MWRIPVGWDLQIEKKSNWKFLGSVHATAMHGCTTKLIYLNSGKATGS